MELAQEITSAFFNDEQAEKARSYFVYLFQKGDLPEEMPEFRIDGEVTLIDVLTNSGTVSSGSEVRRLLKQNGIKVDEEKVDDPYLILRAGSIVQVGKRRFLKIVSE
jgi:tyrosyl-tRNA synthetase